MKMTVIYKNISFDNTSPIAYLTINRPKSLNSLSQQTLVEIVSVLEDVREDRSVRGLILTGAGSRAFVAGADIREIATISALDASDFARRGQAALDLIENLGKPVIAAVNGYALGGGCEIAMACTLRIATEGAKFGQPEVKLGVIPGFGGTQRLARLIGKGLALQMILTGEPIDAQEAHRIGLVNEIVPPNRLIRRAEEILQLIIANAPLAVRFSLDAVNQGLNVGQSEALAIERSLFAICASTHDKKEGTSAFMEKRTPHFIGQ